MVDTIEKTIMTAGRMNLIKNSDLVSSAMGYWPSFHDAEVLQFEASGRSVTLKIHPSRSLQRLTRLGSS